MAAGFHPLSSPSSRGRAQPVTRRSPGLLLRCIFRLLSVKAGMEVLCSPLSSPAPTSPTPPAPLLSLLSQMYRSLLDRARSAMALFGGWSCACSAARWPHFQGSVVAGSLPALACFNYCSLVSSPSVPCWILPDNPLWRSSQHPAFLPINHSNRLLSYAGNGVLP